MELRRLEIFVAVAEELHFGRAARRLHMAQPPLSRQLKALESELGFALLSRSRRRVELTDGGARFLPEARRVLAQAARAQEVAEQLRTGSAGLVRIGYVGSAVHGVLPPLIRAFRALAPDARVALDEKSSSTQVEGILGGLLDVGILRDPVGAPGLRTEILMREPLVAALPFDHPLAARRSVRPEALAGEPWILFPRTAGPALYDLTISVAQAAGYSPRIVQESPWMQTILTLVDAGLGVSLVPASTAGIAGPGVRFRPLEGVEATTELVLARRRGEPEPLVDALMGAAARAFGPAAA